MTDFSSREDRLLRALDPPPLSAGFADRVMAGLPRGGTQARATGRDRRGGWRRISRPLLAGVGFAVLSVGAAASGLLGTRIQNMPVIASIAESVAPEPKPAPKPVQVAAKPKTSAQAKTPEIVNAEPLATPREAWREERAERIVDRLERRAERRKEMGLPPRDPQARRAIRRQLAAMPTAERRALVQEIRKERLERMTPEQRERWEAWRERRHTLRDMGRDGLQGGPLIVPESADPPETPTPTP
jgi:hypothetical protein